ncbi:MAG: DUF1329 domain-containing protein [Candidatus Binataceae bacterium]
MGGGDVTKGRLCLSGVGLAALLLCCSTVSAYATDPAAPVPVAPGTKIDASNYKQFAQYIPAALAFAFEHGLKGTIVPTARIDWPADYKAATEKYASQVRLDDHDVMQNYVAGLPFPLVDPSDPKAAVKIAYNWHWGPFTPDDAILSLVQKNHAYKAEPSDKTTFTLDDDHRDWRNEGTCDETRMLRHPHRSASVAAGSTGSDIDYRFQGKSCGADNNARVCTGYMGIRARLECYNFWRATRQITRSSSLGAQPAETCSYSCVQLWWEFVPPEVEAYAYRLGPKRLILAVMDSSGAPLDLKGEQARFAEQQFQLRYAYALEMKPIESFADPATVYLDSETYLYLGANFTVHLNAAGAGPIPAVEAKMRATESAGETTDSAVPFWRPEADGVITLAGDIYVPGDRSDFFLGLALEPDSQQFNTGQLSPSIFSPAWLQQQQ